MFFGRLNNPLFQSMALFFLSSEPGASPHLQVSSFFEIQACSIVAYVFSSGFLMVKSSGRLWGPDFWIPDDDDDDDPVYCVSINVMMMMMMMMIQAIV